MGALQMADEDQHGSVELVRAAWVVPVEGDVVTDGAVAISGADLVAVGPFGEVRAQFPDAPVEHLRSHALIPGLVNAHTHLGMTMFRGVADDRTLAEFLDTVIPLEGRLLGAERVGTATRAALVESHLGGVTTALDMYFFEPAVLEAAEETGGRVFTGPVILDAAGPDAPPGSWDKRMHWAASFFDEHPAVDGWRPVVGPHTIYTVEPPHLREAADLARSVGAVMHIHAGETADEVEMVTGTYGARPLELLGDLGVLGGDTVIAHGVHLLDHEIELLASTGTSVAHCPASNLKLASGIAPVQRLRNAGVTVALGTDGAASSNDLDLLGAARLAALLHKAAGPDGPDATILAAPEVLDMATRQGAEALGVADRLGSLTPGRLADVVALDLDRAATQPVHDVCSAIVYAAGRDNVTDVWSSGRRVVRGGRHQLVDEADVVRDLRSLGAVVEG